MIMLYRNYVLSVLFWMPLLIYGQEQKFFVFVTASYNNEQWVKRNLESMFLQNYDNWRLIYINDCSTDSTSQLAYELIGKYDMGDRVIFIDNAVRRGHLANQYDAIHSCQDWEIVVNVDGDDWLAHKDVLSYLNTVYADPDVWMTYGQYKRVVNNKTPPCCREIPAHIVRNNSIRTYYPWRLSHMRTFYAGLFKKIKKVDLMHEGVFFPAAADRATMFPMFEMAAGRYKFIEKILYVYNDNNSLNCHKVRASQGQKCAAIIHASRPYKPLETLDF